MYENEKVRELWSLWLSEIDSFSQLPLFFSTFCQDRDKEQIIYNLLDGQYDNKDKDIDISKVVKDPMKTKVEAYMAENNFYPEVLQRSMTDKTVNHKTGATVRIFKFH